MKIATNNTSERFALGHHSATQPNGYLARSSKMSILLAICEQAHHKSEKVVIFAKFLDSVDVVMEALQQLFVRERRVSSMDDFVKITGGKKGDLEDTRRARVEEFNRPSGRWMVLICTKGKCSEGWSFTGWIFPAAI